MWHSSQEKRNYHSNDYVDSKNITIQLLVAIICKVDECGPMINYLHLIESEQKHFPNFFSISFFSASHVRMKCIKGIP